MIIHRPGWQSLDDWRTVAQRLRRVDPSIGVIIARHDVADTRLRDLAAALPSLVFSPGRLGAFVPSRGKVYHGRVIPKFEQLRRLEAAGVPVPMTAVLRPGMQLSPEDWGPFVIVKPTDIGSSSHGVGITLMRTERVRYVPPNEYPEGHPGRLGPMLVQRFVNTGPQVKAYRVLTLFGEPLYSDVTWTREPVVDLSRPDDEIEAMPVATQRSVPAERALELRYEADVAALARAAHRAMPEAPLKGVDVIRDLETGRLFVLEVNPGGNTWHFSSDMLAAARAMRGPELARQRIEQRDAFGTAAHVLAAVTRAEAE